MDIGVVLQCTPPAARVVDLARRAETYGFDYVWTFDSHILWEEPYVLYSRRQAGGLQPLLLGSLRPEASGRAAARGASGLAEPGDAA